MSADKYLCIFSRKMDSNSADTSIKVHMTQNFLSRKYLDCHMNKPIPIVKT